MKSVNSLVKWILFVPVCLFSVALTVFSSAAPEAFSSAFSADRNAVAKIIAFAILGLFVVGYVMSLIDKKTSPAHMLRKNPFCGVMAVISALAMAAAAAYDVTTMINSDEIRLMSVMTVIFTAISGVAMLYVGLNHFSGANTPKPLSLLYLALPVWCGIHLIDRFLTHTDSPVAAADTMDLIMFVAMAMFFINAMMIHAVIIGKGTVKSSITFGLPAVVSAFVYGISSVFTVLNSQESAVLDILPAVVYILLGLYILGFTVELSFKSKTVDEQFIADEAEESEGYSEEYYSDEEETEEVCDTVAEEEYEDADSLETEVEAEQADTTADTAYGFNEAVSSHVLSFEDDVDTDNAEEKQIPELEFDDEPVVEPKEITEADIAYELFKAAQQKDSAAADTADSDESLTDETDSKQSKTALAFGGKDKSSGKLKGPTTREAIAYGDDEFILSVDNIESSDPGFDENEDVSAFILEHQDKPEDDNKKSYEERLDEIDKLIISIQGGDADTEEK